MGGEPHPSAVWALASTHANICLALGLCQPGRDIGTEPSSHRVQLRGPAVNHFPAFCPKTSSRTTGNVPRPSWLAAGNPFQPWGWGGWEKHFMSLLPCPVGGLRRDRRTQRAPGPTAGRVSGKQPEAIGWVLGPGFRKEAQLWHGL